MNTYEFNTTTTMKDYNCKKWWIDSNIIPTIRINAENIKAALIEYKNKVYDRSYVTISENALRTKSPMYIDTVEGTKQVGYVITGSCDFQDDYYRWSKQFIDLWVDVHIINDTDFEEV